MDEEINLILDPETQLVVVEDDSPTISVQWDQAVQEAVINTAVGPTVASRAYGMVHTAIFDAWAAYEDIPVSTRLGDNLQRPSQENTETNKIEAMSYSAYRVLVDLFPTQTGIFDDLMAELGFDPSNTTNDATTPAGIGNVSAAALLDFRHNDGSNQLGDNPNGNGTAYSDISGYEPTNAVGNSSVIDLWTPEFVPIDAEPVTEEGIQAFLTPHWGNVTPFSLTSGDQFRPVAPQPFLLVEGEVNLDEGTITLIEDGSVVDITPEIVGTIINPEFIAQTEEVVAFSANLTDEQKLIAEFWEDPGGTSFPPGTWMTFGQFVSARDGNTLDEDALMFFALGNAVFDAGVATWEAKSFYDYTRPVRLVRDLGSLGLIGEFNEELGGYAIEAWGGIGAGTQTILATDFLTYQTPGSDPSPPFAEYTSGHSAFSAAGAEILRLFTGSDEFGASVTFEPGESRFEPGVTPSQAVTLEWSTFSEAADEAGISRLYGGIHFDEGDINGRILGREVGDAVYEQAQFYLSGGGINPAAKLAQVDNNSGILTLDGFGATNLQVTLNSNNSTTVNELGLFTVDDTNGTINNLTPGTEGYLEAALGRSQVLFSVLANTPNGFDTSNISRILGSFDQDATLGFYLITNDTTNTVLAEIEQGGVADANILLSTLAQSEISTSEGEGFSLNWEPESASDLVVNIQTTVDSVTSGTQIQTNREQELIDLSNETGSVQVNVNVYREAEYNNFVGLYRLANEDGAVADPTTDELITPTAANRQSYIEAVIANRVEGLDLSVENQGTATFTEELAGGAIYAPFIIADGNLDSLGNDFSNFYLPFMEVNPDEVDHIRLLGNNAFGFEDLPDGGDFDFNDIVVELEFV